MTHFAAKISIGGFKMKRFSSKRYLVCFLLIGCMCALIACGGSNSGSNPKIHTAAELVDNWGAALQYLADGNKRFIENKGITRNTNKEDRDILKDGQKPFAVVVTCADSRVAPEIYFDQKLGDIFVIRNAGNIADAAVLGSIEYAVEHLHSPLVVVVGHSKCGAVTGALSSDGHFPENLQTIIDTIVSNIKGTSDLGAAINNNVNSTVNLIKENHIVEEVGAKVIGAHYNIESGEVTFFN